MIKAEIAAEKGQFDELPEKITQIDRELTETQN
jgi:hypothetical protein